MSGEANGSINFLLAKLVLFNNRLEVHKRLIIANVRLEVLLGDLFARLHLLLI